MKKHRETRRQRAKLVATWQCVSCSFQEERSTVDVSHWLNLPGGRMCRRCQQRWTMLPVGAYVDVGHGWKIVKVSD